MLKHGFQFKMDLYLIYYRKMNMNNIKIILFDSLAHKNII